MAEDEKIGRTFDWNSDFCSLGAAHDQEVGVVEITNVGEEKVLAIRDGLEAEIIELCVLHIH